MSDDAAKSSTGDAHTSPTASLIVDGVEQLLVRQFRLSVFDGPDRGLELSAKRERTTLGTALSNDFVLQDRTVSRFHCQIHVNDGKAIVRDLGSHNGTVVNGVRIHEAPLAAGAILELGRNKLRFELGETHFGIPLSAHSRFGHLVGRSPQLRAAFRVLERAAESDGTVLLIGETGTGKDAAARSIHEASSRKDRPLVALDCGAIPAALLESELFGHERGAFTGATSSRVGAFQQAAGGTLFLDEIGELAVDLQPKLLRVLEAREIRPVGGSRTLPVDVRIIAATNRDLYQEVNSRRFRADLYYRLAVLEVHLPALRECHADLPLLIGELLDRLGARQHPLSTNLQSPELITRLGSYGWPGNARELRNYLERCLALGSVLPVGAATREPGQAEIDVSVPLKVARQQHVEQFERQYLERLLEAHSGNVSAAARAAGMDRAHLHRLLVRAKLR
jgi:transcriptional regulator with GAF, ATPase, and Fis domain